MDLYLIRHAEAEPKEPAGKPDAERELTPAGREQARLLAEAFRSHGVTLDVVVTSPLARARQTAEAFQPFVEAGEVSPLLAPGNKPRKLVRYLLGLGKQRLGLVGHDPDLSELAAWLIGSRKAHVALAKAGVAYVACDGDPDKGAGTLNWMLAPEWVGWSPGPAAPAAPASGSATRRGTRRPHGTPEAQKQSPEPPPD
jgi:phosphohistidine phosphatase